MTLDEYLAEIIKKRSNNGEYSEAEARAFSRLKRLIIKWAETLNADDSIPAEIAVEVLPAGSRAKGTAIRGKSDLDLFVSVTDRAGDHPIRELYYSLYEFLRASLPERVAMRRQDVSIGLKYRGRKIDVTVGKRYNGSYYTSDGRRYDDHWIYSRRRDARMLTNIQKHIELVKYSGLADEIMLLKIWKDENGINLPSIYFEIFAKEVLGASEAGLGENFTALLSAIEAGVTTRRIVDPSNSANVISADIPQEEKEKAKLAAARTLELLAEDPRKGIW